MSVAQSLGLTSKRANRALAAFAAKHRIRETFAQQGKAQIKVSAPRALHNRLGLSSHSRGSTVVGGIALDGYWCNSAASLALAFTRTHKVPDSMQCQ